jgi:hypothetical protein
MRAVESMMNRPIHRLRKWRRFFMAVTFLTWLAWTPEVTAQINSGNPEQFRLHTDRPVYVAGESIHFRVFNVSGSVFRMAELSTVWYMELVSPTGTPYSRHKAALDRDGASGWLRIPLDIPSGTYYLKGYTRWMRNLGPSFYNYLSVEIVNPGRRQLQPVDTTSSFTVSLNPVSPVSENRIIVLKGLLDSYHQREEVNFELAMDPSLVTDRLFITVTPRDAMVQQYCSPGSPYLSPVDTMRQLPDTRGVSLSGQVRSTETGEPVPYSIVYISTLGSQRDFYCNYTDSSGRFYVSFSDFQGERELFISAMHPDLGLLDLYIDQDFCTEPLRLPSYPPLHGLPNLETLGELVVNAGIAEQFFHMQDAAGSGANGKEGFFYGTPPVTVRFDDYIRLPTLREYFSELVPHVSVRGAAQKAEFRVTGQHADLQFFPPLVMIDGVAIFDHEAVLTVSPAQVDRVEIVDAPYIRGNVTFGGIINIITREGNLGFVDLPSSGMLINYDMYGEGTTDPLMQLHHDASLPDVRNTLFWQPEVRPVEGYPGEIRFRTGDTRETYRVTVAGYLEDGSFVRTSSDFSVR